MRTFLLFLTAITFFSISSYGQMKYWEDLNDQQKSDILGVCKSVSIKRFYEGNKKIFYEGKFKPTEDNITSELLAELVASNDTILPLSFYLFNKILINSDGDIGEMFEELCAKFLAKHPLYILPYFSKERILKVKKPVWKTYAMFVGVGLYFKICGTSDLKYSYKRYREILVSASKDNKENEETFRLFWQIVDKTIKMMNVEGGKESDIILYPPAQQDMPKRWW